MSLAIKCMRRYCLLGTIATTLASAQLLTPAIKSGDHVDAVAITVTRFGPYPTSIERSKGPFVLFIANRSGVLDDTFSLVPKPTSSAGATPATNSSLLDLHSTQTKQRDHQLIDALPGSYQLRFQSHPDWVVDIKITAN